MTSSLSLLSSRIFFFHFSNSVHKKVQEFWKIIWRKFLLVLGISICNVNFKEGTTRTWCWSFIFLIEQINKMIIWTERRCYLLWESVESFVAVSELLLWLWWIKERNGRKFSRQSLIKFFFLFHAHINMSLRFRKIFTHSFLSVFHLSCFFWSRRRRVIASLWLLLFYLHQ